MKQTLMKLINANWKKGLLLLAFLFVLNSVVPATLLFRKKEIINVRIARITYPKTKEGEPRDYKQEVVVLTNQSEIEQFTEIWSGQLLVLPPNWSGTGSHNIDDTTENYFILVSYDDTFESINIFDNYGNPIRINDRHLWFSLFRSREQIYLDIEQLFDQMRPQ